MMPFDPHPECRKCGSASTEWRWGIGWIDDVASLLDERLMAGGVEAIRVMCTRCGFAWLMATKEEKA